MFLLMICSDIVATSVDICNEHDGIRAKQQQNKKLSEENGTQVQRKRSTQIRNWGIKRNLPSAVVVADVLVLVLLLLCRMILRK